MNYIIMNQIKINLIIYNEFKNQLHGDKMRN